MIEIFRSIAYLLKVNKLFSFFWRPANRQVRESVTFTMKGIFKDHNLNGKLSINKVDHVGFAPGIIVVDYSYSENVNGKQITLTEQMSGLDDDGEPNYSLSAPDYGGEFVQFVKKSSLQQPYYSKTSKEIYSELKKTRNK